MYVWLFYKNYLYDQKFKHGGKKQCSNYPHCLLQSMIYFMISLAWVNYQ